MSCPSSIRRGDSNPRPFEHESPPVTTRPGLPPVFYSSFRHDYCSKQDRVNEQSIRLPRCLWAFGSSNYLSADFTAGALLSDNCIEDSIK